MRGYTLVLEAATERASVALALGERVVGHTGFAARARVTRAPREWLAPAVAECLAAGPITPAALDRVVCDAGPGGFTSLRAAAALAKGLCAALERPLYAISSLELLARAASLADGSYIAALDAGRGECFASTVVARGGELHVAAARLITEAGLAELALCEHARVVGPGREIDAWPTAVAAVAALDELAGRGPVALDSWEPAYGRLAEAQVRWEAAQGRPLAAAALVAGPAPKGTP